MRASRPCFSMRSSVDTLTELKAAVNSLIELSERNERAKRAVEAVISPHANEIVKLAKSFDNLMRSLERKPKLRDEDN